MAFIHKADLIGGGRLVANAVVIHAVSSQIVGEGGMARVEVLPANDDYNSPLALLRWLVRHGRQDCHAVGYGEHDYGKPIHEQLSDDDLRQHLAGTRVVAVYPMAAGSSETSVGIYVIDNHAGAVPWDAVAKVALRIAAAARQRGLYIWPARSGDGHGIHLWLRWNERQQAPETRGFMAKMLQNAGLAAGADGIAIEIIPVPAGGYDSPITLPFGHGFVPLTRLWSRSTSRCRGPARPRCRHRRDDPQGDTPNTMHDHGRRPMMMVSDMPHDHF
jgi:hypothetical protein